MDIHEEHLKNFFEAARGVRPAEHFRERSRMALFEAPRKSPSVIQRIRREFIENLTFGFSIGLAAVFIFVAFGGTSSWERLVPGNPAQTEAGLLSEAASLDFQIQLRQLEYAKHSAAEVAVMVQSLTTTGEERKDIDALLKETF